MINYGKHFIDKADLNAVKIAMQSQNITQGNIVERFESCISKKFGSKYCLAVNSGTAALHLAIKSLSIKQKNFEVLTTPITFSATASSVLMNNLNLHLSDINPNNFTLDLNKVEDKLKKNSKIKLIIGVDYAGHPCDWLGLSFLKKKYDVFLINDNCHSMGSKLNNSIQYAAAYADIVTHSYHPVKNFTTGEGGAILSNSEEVYKFCKLLRSHGIARGNLMKEKINWHYKIDTYGYNYRLTDFQSALGITQLKKLDKFILKRRAIANLYNKAFKNHEYLKLPSVAKNVYNSYHLYPLRVDFKKKKISKISFFKHMFKKGINLQMHYIPLYYHRYLKKFRFNKRDFPVAEDFYQKEVSMPIFYSLRLKDQKSIIRETLKYLI